MWALWLCRIINNNKPARSPSLHLKHKLSLYTCSVALSSGGRSILTQIEFQFPQNIYGLANEIQLLQGPWTSQFLQLYLINQMYFIQNCLMKLFAEAFGRGLVGLALSWSRPKASELSAASTQCYFIRNNLLQVLSNSPKHMVFGRGLTGLVSYFPKVSVSPENLMNN